MSVSANQGSGENIMYIFLANQKNLEVCFSQKDHVNFFDYQKNLDVCFSQSGPRRKYHAYFLANQKNSEVCISQSGLRKIF